VVAGKPCTHRSHWWWQEGHVLTGVTGGGRKAVYSQESLVVAGKPCTHRSDWWWQESHVPTGVTGGGRKAMYPQE